MAKLSRAQRDAIAQAAEREAAASNALMLDDLAADPLAPVRPYMAQAGLDSVDAKFYVYRIVDEGTKPDAFLFKCKPEDFDPELIGRRYGTGTYRIKIYVKDEDHPNGVIRGGGIFPIEMPSGYKPEPLAAPPSASASLGALGEPSTFERMFLQMMAEGQKRTEDLLGAIAKARDVAPPDPLAMMRQVGEVMKSLIPPPAPVAAGAGGGDFMTIVNAAKTLLDISKGMAPSAAAPDDPEAPIGERLFNRAASQVVDLIAAGAAGKLGNGAAPAALAAPETPAASAAPVASAAGGATITEENENMIVFKHSIRQAARAAAAGENPEEYAEDIFGFLSDENIVGFDTPNWFAILAHHVPEVAPHQAWFARVHAKIIALAREDGILPPALEGSNVVTLTGADKPASVAASEAQAANVGDPTSARSAN